MGAPRWRLRGAARGRTLAPGSASVRLERTRPSRVSRGGGSEASSVTPLSRATANARSSWAPRRGRTFRARASSSPARSGEESVSSVVAGMFASPLAFGVAGIPLVLATSAAFAVTRQVLPFTFASLALASVLVIVWLNVTNDVFDSETGVDSEKVESVVNRTGQKGALFWVATFLLACGLSIFAAVVAIKGQLAAGAMLLGSVAIGYVYQGPPFRLSYKGVGEVLCFFAFGPLATNAFFLLQSGLRLPCLVEHPVALASSVLLGLTTSAILLNSHYHQVDTDRATGKVSPCVRFGTRAVSRAVVFVVAAAYCIFGCCLTTGILPRTAIVALLSLPSALSLCRLVLGSHQDKVAIKPAKFFAVRWHKNFALLLSLGLFLS